MCSRNVINFDVYDKGAREMSWRECKNKTNANDAEELYVKRRQGFVVFLCLLKGRVCESMSGFSLETCQISLEAY